MRTVTIAAQLACGRCTVCLEKALLCFSKFEGVTDFAYDGHQEQVTLTAQDHITNDAILDRFRCLGYFDAKIVA